MPTHSSASVPFRQREPVGRIPLIPATTNFLQSRQKPTSFNVNGTYETSHSSSTGAGTGYLNDPVLLPSSSSGASSGYSGTNNGKNGRHPQIQRPGHAR